MFYFCIYQTQRNNTNLLTSNLNRKMKTKLLILVAFCMTMGTFKAKATVSGVRTATSVAVVWTIDPLAVSYKVYGLNNVVLKTVAAPATVVGQTTVSANITGLKPNTEYTFNVSSFDASNNETQLGMVDIFTRMSGANYEIIDDFDDVNTSTWGVSNKGTFTPQQNNTVLSGDSSALAAEWQSMCSSTSNRNYAGPLNTMERLTVGPNAPFQFLHVKMYRVVTGTPLVGALAELGGFSLQCNQRADSATMTGVNIKKYYLPQFVDGVWHDYVYDLKALGAGVDKSFFNWYIKMNEFGGGSYALQTDYYAFIDDIYLSNDGNPLGVAISPVAVTLVAGANGTVPVSGTYLKGSTITALPATGYVVDKWSMGSTVISTTAACVIPRAGTLTATFKLASGINDLIEGGIIKITDKKIEFLRNVSSVEIFNTVGSMIRTQNNVSEGTSISLNRGIYLVRVKSDQGLKIQKVIIQ